MESILTSTKKLLGIAEEYTHFDADIVMHVNSVLAILTQLGVGPPGGFAIEDASATWEDFMGNDPRLSLVKSYVHQKVRLLFDPPLSSAVTEVLNRMTAELEWRITAAAGPEKDAEEG